jgi:hypothetical protein
MVSFRVADTPNRAGRMISDIFDSLKNPLTIEPTCISVAQLVDFANNRMSRPIDLFCGTTFMRFFGFFKERLNHYNELQRPHVKQL